MAAAGPTAFDEVMGVTNRLLGQAQALAATTARLRLDELGVEGDPAVREQLERVVDELGVRAALDALAPQERAFAAAFARSYLRQALELVEEPARDGAWTHTDPALLNAQGTASGAVARLIAGAGLGSDDARILDVGTGVAGLAIAFCRTFPGATVVGLDPWEPALVLARANVAEAGLEDRIALVGSTMEEYEDAEGFDLVWFPSFFVREAALEAALARVHALSRPGATLVVGLASTPDDPLAAAVDDLFTVRSGGSVLDPAGAIGRVEGAGFEDVREVERTWQAPLRFVAGRRA